MQQKNELRKGMLAKRRALTEEQAAANSARVCEELLAADIWQGIETVLAYLPYGRELNVWPLFADLWAKGLRIAVPVCSENERGKMVAALLTPETELVRKSLGVLEPVEPQFIMSEEIDVVLVPGVVFDQKGNRMGHGAGYYDRYLACCSALVIGVAHQLQVVEELPAEPWDIQMDMLCTEAGLVNFEED